MRHHLARLPLASRILLGVPALVLLWLLLLASLPLGVLVGLLGLCLLWPEAFRPSWWKRQFARWRG